MNKIEKLIPAAVGAVQLKMANNFIVKKAYNGYISSFGASIIQCGLLPTLAMYKGTENSEKKKAETGHLLAAIYEVVKSKQNPEPAEDNLFSYALNKSGDSSKRQALLEDILNASIAVKLAIRTFKLEE